MLEDRARALGLRACVLTFEPHPRELFAPQTAPTRLTSLSEKLELLAAHGVECVQVSRFNRGLCQPLAAGLHRAGAAIGAGGALAADRRRFPFRRAPRRRFRAAAGGVRKFGFGVEAMPTVAQRGRARVEFRGARGARRGPAGGAEALLGRPYSISGRVVHGDKLGRSSGFRPPTCSCGTTGRRLSGIFAAAHASTAAGARARRGEPGRAPDGGQQRPRQLEVHLFDFDGDLYGRHCASISCTKCATRKNSPTSKRSRRASPRLRHAELLARANENRTESAHFVRRDARKPIRPTATPT